MSMADVIMSIVNSKRPDVMQGEEQRAADIAAQVELRKQKIETADKLNPSPQVSHFFNLLNIGVKK